jgi:hypothetical protein
VSLPTTQTSNVVAPFWDDLVAGADASSNVFWAVTGSSPHRELVIEWRNVTAYACDDATKTVTFQIVFFEGTSDIVFNYADTSFGGSLCASSDGAGAATVGVQTSSAVARQHSFNSPSVSDGTALLWSLPPCPAHSPTPR